MDRVKKRLRNAKVFFKTDWNIARARRLVTRGVKAAPSATVVFLSNKFPLGQWMPVYNFRWLPGDMISGVTVGIFLTLQAVNLAIPFPGGISIQQTLLASWLPGFLYAATGTSKHISIGPTTSGPLLSLGLVGILAAVTKIPPQIILPALTLSVGLWFLAFGLLGLGFIFDLIPVYFCLALVTALSIMTIVLQVPILLGLQGIPPSFMTIPPAIFQNLTNISTRTVAISISAIVFLAALRFLTRKFGKAKTLTGRASRLGVGVGSLLVVLIFSLVSFALLRNLPTAQQVAPFVPPFSQAQAAPGAGVGVGVGAASANSTGGTSMSIPRGLQGASARGPRQAPGVQFPSGNFVRAAASSPSLLPSGTQSATNLSAAASTAQLAGLSSQTTPPKLPFWAIFPEFNTPIGAPRMPIMQFVKILFIPSFLVFLTLNIEHVVVARAFSHKHVYTISKSQEMFSIGLINILNSLFGGMPVAGGDVARSSILAVTGAKSPLSQVFTSVTVLIAMMPASQALRFLPQAALSSMLVVAIFDQMPPQKMLNEYFKLSFADFIAFFLVFNIGIVAPAPIGTIAAVGLGIVYILLYTTFRVMFSKPRFISNADLEAMYQSSLKEEWQECAVPLGMLIMKVERDMIWTNAERVRRHIVDNAYLRQSGLAVELIDAPERAWNSRIDKHADRLRRKHARSKRESKIQFRPRLRVVILDMSATSFMDSTATMNLEMMKQELRNWAGENVEFRFVGLNKHLKKRFERAKWHIIDPYGPQMVVEGEEEDNVRDLMFDHLPQAIRYVNQDLIMNGTFEDMELGLDIKG